MRMFSRWSRQQRRVLLPTHVAAFKEAVMKMMMMMKESQKEALSDAVNVALNELSQSLIPHSNGNIISFSYLETTSLIVYVVLKTGSRILDAPR
jgi:hypothetical protein